MLSCITMDAIDKRILNMIQTGFPLEKEPLKGIAEKMGLGEEDILRRIEALKTTGVIRRIGAVFESRRLEFVSTLCAARVPQEKVKDFVGVVNAYPGVTHNYRRAHDYNVWFTLIAPSEESLLQAISEISDRTGVRDILDLRATRIFKIDAHFPL